MAEVITMPRLSDTMTEGVIVVWHKKVGDNIEVGDILADVETLDDLILNYSSVPILKKTIEIKQFTG